MRIVVIGGSGHIGTFLVPRLVRAGHDVISVTRSGGTGYASAPEWDAVTQVTADRRQQDADGTFGTTILGLDPDVVVDLVCFSLESATALVEALRGRVDHLIHCGSIWRYGPSRRLPIAEGDDDAAGAPFDEYGIQKAAIARMLHDETAAGGLVTTSLHPGHIVGPGWHPTGPLGNTDPASWHVLSSGGTLRVPGSGTETLHHVHADDVAQAFALAVEHRDAAAGEDMNIVAPTALSVRGYVEIASAWFGQAAEVESITWEEHRASTTEHLARESWGHLHRSHVFTIEKARRLLGYAPRYEPHEAILESVRWLIDHGELEVAGPLRV
ncbi:NAD(P)-dependent oxidoreductase [Brachybacterium huguangmaarense]|uniref:NAD(P)-dependent oxidoreductase n=1 Tax=Brachybacterium huguangmaarense TaxID=1652028 RepID=A0ABY6G062_9MICO|nr:NAD(P)-dependent oxidoreductase [Brachybacterium huguangmaarense]UYG16226.1 NAD(P)-dependent oxidoreductase [Brachybacterium huguangmaarense]